MVNGCGLTFWSEITLERDHGSKALLNDLRADKADEKGHVNPGLGAAGFNRYLTAAGIDYEDGAGRVADFHSVRHTAGTLLAATLRASEGGAEPHAALGYQSDHESIQPRPDQAGT